jgi:hypothetical protein
LNAAASTEETASLAGFARLLGVKPSAVTALKQAGRLVMTDDGKRVRIDASRLRIAETADPSKGGVAARHAAERAAKVGEAPAESSTPEGEGQEDDAGTPGYQASRAKREHYAALAAARDYEVSIGKLLDAAEVTQAVAQAATTLRTQLEALPDILAPQLAAIADEAQVRATLAEAIEHALEETSRQFFAIARQGDA